jgi:hypothetical protein
MLLVGACEGGGGSDSTTTSIPSSTTSPSTTASSSSTSAATSTSVAPQDPARAEKAKAAVLQPNDFPTGWAPKPEDERLDHETTWRELTRCLGEEDSGQGLAVAVSPTFGRGPATQVTSAVEYLPGPTAQALAAAFGGPKMTECAKAAFTADVKRNAPPDATVGPVEVAPFNFALLGQATSSTRATTTIDLGFPIRVTQDFVIVFEAESVSRVSFLAAEGPFEADLQRVLVEKVVARA